VDDVLGGDDAWKNVAKTNSACAGCLGRPLCSLAQLLLSGNTAGSLAYWLVTSVGEDCHVRPLACWQPVHSARCPPQRPRARPCAPQSTRVRAAPITRSALASERPRHPSAEAARASPPPLVPMCFNRGHSCRQPRPEALMHGNPKPLAFASSAACVPPTPSEPAVTDTGSWWPLQLGFLSKHRLLFLPQAYFMEIQIRSADEP
jgi:hypothetical protein